MKLPERFIVVDDDSINNMICKLALQRFSSIADIKTFTNPEVALQFVKDSYINTGTNMPTMLFLDINMPNLTGWDVLDIFEGLPQEIKQQFNVYILSSSIDERDKKKAEIYPLVKGFLSKPLSADIISDILDPINTFG